MREYESLPKVLPVPDHLDEKILRHAADFAARRRQRHTRNRLVFSFAAAAAALMIATFVLLPGGGRAKPQGAVKTDVPEWSTLDQESYVLCAEINSWNEEFSI